MSPAQSWRNGIHANASQTPKPKPRDPEKGAHSSRAATRPPIYRPWNGREACAASSAASRPSGSRTWAGEPFFSEFRVSNPESKRAIAWRSGARGPAAISARAPTSRRISSAPASTSSSHLRNWRRRRRKPRLRADTSRRLRNVSPQRRHGGDAISGMARLPPALRKPRGISMRSTGCCRSRTAAKSFHGHGAKAGHDSALMTTPSLSSQASGIRARCREARNWLSRGTRRPGWGPSESALYPYQREGALFAARAGRA